MVEGFLTTLHAMDHAFVPDDDTLERLPTPSVVGHTRVGGVDINKPRMRVLLAAVLALAPAPQGFRVADVAAQVRTLTGQTADAYGPRHAAYDLKKLRAKHLVETVPSSRRYRVPPREPAPSLPWSSCATKSSSRSWRARPSPKWAGSQRPGALSTSTMKRSARTCRPCSRIWALPHRQSFVDVGAVSAYRS